MVTVDVELVDWHVDVDIVNGVPVELAVIGFPIPSTAPPYVQLYNI